MVHSVLWSLILLACLPQTAVFTFFSLSFMLCYFLFTSAFDSNWQFFKPKRHLLKPELVTLARSCYSHTVKFQNIFFLSRAKKHFDIVIFFVVADIISIIYNVFLYIWNQFSPKKFCVNWIFWQFFNCKLD